MSSLKHIGMPRRSGRYPWGSGGNPHQHGESFIGTVSELKKRGLTEKQIAEGQGISIAQLRSRVTIEKARKRQMDYEQALRLKEKGYSDTEIGKMMNRNESSIRSLLNPVIQERSQLTSTTANILKDAVAKKEYVDVGLGTENHIGISRTRLKAAIEMLEEEGYQVHYLTVPQAGTNKKTSLMVLTNGEKEYGERWKEVNANKEKIKMVNDVEIDSEGRTDYGLKPIKNVDSKRILVKFDEDGGTDKDGLIELRRGVEDLNLGNATYAQVRIAVDGTHYLKGMSMYTDDIPKGVDIIYNTNKKRGTPVKSANDKDSQVFKPMEKDKDGNIDKNNPFGAEVKKGGQRGALNILNEEGDWSKWNNALSSQMLSKQNPSLIKQQLDLALAIRKDELAEYRALNNPTVRKKLLETFAESCDSDAVHLQAAALPRQGTHVILPFPNMKPDQVYAPKYNDGETVVLIRHPHGGIFEIPQLTVNNKNSEVKKALGNAVDAIGIHPKVAQQLSGADFDGDNVLVIPTNGRTIKTSSPLKQLQNFDPKEHYRLPKDAPKMTSQTKGMKMGDISNLITDMSIKGASEAEIVRAVKHSMVVIDAEKHHLDYKQSYIDNGIGALKKKWQGSERAGASTIVSKASSQDRPLDRKEYFKVDPLTGKKIWEYTGETFVDKKGRVIPKRVMSTKMAETEDAYKLSSGTIKENIYADYANKLKALANETRKEAYHTGGIKYDSTANKTYAKEVSSLRAKLNVAQKNAPLERQAQLFANKVLATSKDANPDMTYKEMQKVKGQAIQEGRLRTGAGKKRINITPTEWEAIQAGAVSNNVLTKILLNTDEEVIKQYATPRAAKTVSTAKLNKAKAMAKSGYTQAEIASAIGVSTSTLAKVMQ